MSYPTAQRNYSGNASHQDHSNSESNAQNTGSPHLPKPITCKEEHESRIHELPTLGTRCIFVFVLCVMSGIFAILFCGNHISCWSGIKLNKEEIECYSPCICWTVVFFLSHLLSLLVDCTLVPSTEVLKTVSPRGTLITEGPVCHITSQHQQKRSHHNKELQRHFAEKKKNTVNYKAK